MTFDELCEVVHQVAGEIGHAVPYELVQQMMGDELVQEVQKQGARVRRSKKTRTPPASVSSRSSDGLEEAMSREPDLFWKASEAAWNRLRQLQQHDLAQAMHWLRLHQPKAHWQLTQFWVERLRDLWESGNLPKFQEALSVWVQLHVELSATYQLVRILQKP